MKTTNLFFLLLYITTNSFAQCYTTFDTDSGRTIALQTDGTLWGWGNNGTGFLGNGNLDQVLYPNTQIGTDNDWSDKISLSDFVLALKTNGSLWAWGSNQDGQCGNGTSGVQNIILTPEQIGTATWLDVGASAQYSLGIKTDGTLWAWGKNEWGQLGIGDSNIQNFLVPVQVGTANNWAKVFPFGSISFAIKTDGTLWSWGSPNGGTLGRTIGATNIPNQVGTSTNWKALSSIGSYSVMGIKTDGTLWIWGRNGDTSYAAYYGNGQIDSNNYENNPTQIGTASDWQSITNSQDNFYGIKNNGTLWDWGRNQVGELGDGTTVTKYVPTQMGVENNWMKVQALDYRVYALKTDHSLYRWGYFVNPPNTTPVLYGANCSLATSTFVNTPKIKVVPNPTHNIVSLQLDPLLNTVNTISLHNALGQEIQVLQNLNTNYNSEIILDLSDYATGVYLVTVRNKEEFYTTKIIKN